MEASNTISGKPHNELTIDYTIPVGIDGVSPDAQPINAVILQLATYLVSAGAYSLHKHIEQKAKALGLMIPQTNLTQCAAEFVRHGLAWCSDKNPFVLKNAIMKITVNKNTMFTGVTVVFKIVFDNNTENVFELRQNVQGEVLEIGIPMMPHLPRLNTQIYDNEGTYRIVRGKITQEVDKVVAKGLRDFIVDGAPFSYTTTRRHAQLGKYREHTDEITAILAALVTSYNSDCQYHDKVGTTLLMTFEKQLKGHLLETGRVGLIMRNGVPIVVDEVTMSLRAFKYSHHGVLMVKITVEFAVVNNGESATASTETFIEV